MADPFIDQKLLGRPPRFGGQEDAWEDWSFTFRAYASTLGPADGTWSCSEWMDSSEEQKTELLNSNLEARAEKSSQQLYFILAVLLQGPSLVLVKKVPRGAGL
jgi:hypothetical protein